MGYTFLISDVSPQAYNLWFRKPNTIARIHKPAFRIAFYHVHRIPSTKRRRSYIHVSDCVIVSVCHLIVFIYENYCWKAFGEKSIRHSSNLMENRGIVKWTITNFIDINCKHNFSTNAL